MQFRALAMRYLLGADTLLQMTLGLTAAIKLGSMFLKRRRRYFSKMRAIRARIEQKTLKYLGKATFPPTVASFTMDRRLETNIE
jgi:hypothetical protein